MLWQRISISFPPGNRWSPCQTQQADLFNAPRFVEMCFYEAKATRFASSQMMT